MPLCGCCACDLYDNISLMRGVGLLLRRKDGCEAEIKGCGGVFNSGKSERTDFLPYHTLLQVCHPVAAVLEKGTTIIA